MIKAILFDFFGVVCNEIGWPWFRKHAKSYEKQENDLRKLFRSFDLGDITESDLSLKLSLMTGIPAEYILPDMKSMAVINRDILALVNILRTKYRVGLFTNANAKFERSVFSEAGSLENHFDPVIISSEVGMVKPEESIYRYVLKTLGVHASEVVLIDDREENLNTGKVLGFQTILFEDLSGLRNDMISLGIKL